MDSPLIVVLLGPPGSGKGTQGARLAQLLGFEHLSLGDALREQIEAGTALGRRVAAAVQDGRLVDDGDALSVVVCALRARAGSRAVFLDGFPRTVAQAEAFAADGEHQVALAIVLEVPDGVVEDRLGARGRADDGPATVRRRLDVYAEEGAPLLAWYEAQGVLRRVDGTVPPDVVTASVLGALLDPSAPSR